MILWYNSLVEKVILARTGGKKMSEIKGKIYTRDYSKPILLNLRGKRGFQTYVKIATSPRQKYDAKAAAKKAAENLRKQGVDV